MAFDALVTNAGRLRILAALAGGAGRDLEFVELRRETELTDGNLASHARRLQGAGLIAIHKSIRQNKPVTSYRLTGEGRAALESHVRALMQAVLPRESDIAPAAPRDDDDWVD
jgi:DNA-binding HxlR family transcriptional regulator